MILQVSNAFIPVIALQAAQIRSWDERSVTMDFKLCLQGKRFITPLIGLG
jgi:hypothetical protein